ncbi:putative plastocyanin-like domain protein [Russula decolorans]
MLAGPHQSPCPLSTSLVIYFSRNTMIFRVTSLALLSGMVLFTSAAPWYSPPAPVTHYVNVSNDTAGLLYDPPYISAAVGDTVSFTFHPKNHTVTQSSFDAPCTPLPGGIDTGFVPVTPGTYDDDLPSWEFIVVGTDPVWIHCSQAANTAASHCGQGMVFAVNPGPEGSNNSFSFFKAYALAVGGELAAVNSTTY